MGKVQTPSAARPSRLPRLSEIEEHGPDRSMTGNCFYIDTLGFAGQVMLNTSPTLTACLRSTLSGASLLIEQRTDGKEMSKNAFAKRYPPLHQGAQKPNLLNDCYEEYFLSPLFGESQFRGPNSVQLILHCLHGQQATQSPSSQHQHQERFDA
eukprot:4008248-Amphidinium_carterae.2